MKNSLKCKSLQFEVLEERLVLTTTTGVFDSLTYEQWRTTTFTLSSMELAEHGSFLLDDVVADGPSAYLTQKDDLIGLDRVRTSFPYSGAGYSVVVIDTGIDYNHSALGGGWGNRVIAGWDFVNNDPDPMDEQGHGTHVAGIIGSSHSTYRGVAPDVNLIALRVLDANGTGSFGAVEDALRWVVAHQAQYNIVAVNMSLGAGNFSFNPYTFLDDELATLVNQGVFIAASSGNSFYSVGSVPGVGFPAISSYAVSVGAVWDANVGGVTWSDGARDLSTAPDRITSFTQRGPALDLLAPGAFVTAPYRGGGFATMSGTSMASPMVAGAAVLLHQALDATGQSHLANQYNILAVLRNTGDLIVDGDDEHDNVNNTGLTFRRIDLYDALVAVAGSSNRSPIISEIADVSVRHGQDFVVTLNVSDPENDPVTLAAAVVSDNAPGVKLSLSGKKLSVDLPQNYVGTFQIQVSASDGNTTSTRSFYVTATNKAPVVSSISDQVLPGNGDSITVPVNVTDGDGDSVTLSATISTPLWDLHQQYGFRFTGNYLHNANGLQEKWFQDRSGTWYFILPTGNIYRYFGYGDIGNNQFVAKVEQAVYNDPQLLFTPLDPAQLATVTVSGKQLQIKPKVKFTGSLVVTVFATDGIATSSRSFNIRVGNNSPTISDISDKVVSHGREVTVQLNAVDPDGDPIQYSVVLRHTLAELQERYRFHSDGQLFDNANGRQEKWFQGVGGWYFVLPTGELYRYLGYGSIDNNVFVADVGTQVYQNPATLYNFPVGISELAEVRLEGTKLTIVPHAAFVGTFKVEVSASDWSSTRRETFTVKVTNQTPTISKLNDVTVSHNTSTTRLPVTIADADGERLDVTVSVLSTQTDYRSKFGFNSPDTFHNANGIGEKWLLGRDGWYFVLANGGLYRYLGYGSIGNNVFVANVGVDAYHDPSRLYNSGSTSGVSASIKNNELVLTHAGAAPGQYRVIVSASDGAAQATREFTFSIVNRAPVISDISSQQLTASQDLLRLNVDVSDPDGDPLSFEFTVSYLLSDLRSQYGFNKPDQFYNANGLKEKWLQGSNSDWFFLLPSGALYRHLGGDIGNNQLVAKLDKDVYSSPSYLYSAPANAAAVEYDGDELIVTPAANVVGAFQVVMTVSDGVATATKSFTVSVASPLSGLTIAGAAGPTLNAAAFDSAPLAANTAADAVQENASTAKTFASEPVPNVTTAPSSLRTADDLSTTEVYRPVDDVAGVHEDSNQIVVASPYTAYSQNSQAANAKEPLSSEQVDRLIRVSRRSVSPREAALTPELAELLLMLANEEVREALVDDLFGV